ncbi:MAG: ornithine cyclodeaminase [Amaricoccus sp.]
MLPRIVTYEEAAGRVSWPQAVEALRAGHLLPRAQITDMLVGPPDATLLSRAAFIEGLGYGMKSVTVFDRNAAQDLPTVQGAMLVFEPSHGALEAIVDSRLVTELKTAADSVLGALCLAREDSAHLLVVGAGAVARSLVDAYHALFPALRLVSVWARRREQADALARSFAEAAVPVRAVTSLAEAAGEADIVACATMARQPVLHGAWIRPGTHVDLVGAYKEDMREADDALISVGALFVDSRETTVHHIGELTIPIASGVISHTSVRGDLYDLVQGTAGRRTRSEITVYKNGGGAHLDLMLARCISETTG